MSKSHSQSELAGSDAQPVAVFWMLSLGAPGAKQAGLGSACPTVAESLPAGFCGDPGLGTRIDRLFVTEQTAGPSGMNVWNGIATGTPGASPTPGSVQVTTAVPVQNG